MYPPRSSKTAFCGQPLRKEKRTPNTKPGPKYLSNRRNIALVRSSKIFCIEIKIQWNLPKADTHGTKNFVRFREVSALERFCLFWPEIRKNRTPKTANLLGIPIIPKERNIFKDNLTCRNKLLVTLIVLAETFLPFFAKGTRI